MKKRIISLFLSIMLLFSAIGLWHVEAHAFSPAYPLPEKTGITPIDIANAARSQLGYVQQNGTVYGNWWGQMTGWGNYTYSEWCAMFSLWCVYHGGVDMGEGFDNGCASTRSWAKWFQKNAMFDNSFTATPQPGDVMFLGDPSGYIRHAVIVVEYDPETNTITYIGGNHRLNPNETPAKAGVSMMSIKWEQGAPRPDRPHQTILGLGRANYGTSGCAHRFSQWQVHGDPECGSVAVEYRSCGICGYDQVRSIIASHSNSTPDVIKAPTCTEAGSGIYTCIDCGETYPGEIAALGHSGEWTVLEAPTYTETGLCERLCTVCGEMEREEMPMLELPFTDVAQGSWYESAVRYVYAGDLMNGTGDTEFQPEATASRAMLSTILWRLEGSPMVQETSHTFMDLTQNWYADAVNWAYENGIVTGISESRFAPDQSVTRQQAAAMLHRYWLYKDYETSDPADLSQFPDAGEVQAYALEPMAWAVSEGLINGVAAQGQSWLEPTSDTTRAQLAAILMRLCEIIEN